MCGNPAFGIEEFRVVSRVPTGAQGQIWGVIPAGAQSLHRRLISLNACGVKSMAGPKLPRTTPSRFRERHRYHTGIGSVRLP